jgi:serine/threonine protein kinase
VVVEPRAEPVAGDVIADRFTLVDQLGAGATAAVWRATDPDGSPVAVKVLRDLGVEPHLATRFEREGQILAALSHPNLVRVIDGGRDGHRPWIAMELLDGPSLADRLRDGGPLEPQEAAGIVADVAAGLERAHAAGVLHRDVKPANIVCDGPIPKLVDFGIARSSALATMTQADMVLGTAAYLSPEQASAHPLDPRSDVYALGCVLHELVAGQPPFPGDSPLTVAYAHVHQPPPPLRSLVPSVPPELEAVVLRCLAKSPADRWPSAGALELELRRFAGKPTSGHTMLMPAMAPAAAVPALDDQLYDPSPLLNAIAPPPPRRYGRAVLVAALAFVVVLGLAALAAGDGDDEPGVDPAGAETTEATVLTTTTVPPPPPTTAAPPEDGDGDGDGEGRPGRGNGNGNGRGHDDDD